MTTATFKLIPFPKQALQARIPSKLAMTREIAKENVSLEVVADRLAEAGYEIEIDQEFNVILVHRTGMNFRLQIYPDLNSIRMRGHFFLNRHLDENDLNALLARLNSEIYLCKFTQNRWDDGDLALFGDYSVYYTFGLNLPNLIFSMRRFIDIQVGVFHDYIKNSAYAYVPETPPEVVSTTADTSEAVAPTPEDN